MPLVGEMYRTERATLVQGDCLDVLRCLEDGEADALVTDPPAGIGFMDKEWDSFKSRSRFVEFLTPRLAECRRVCRPGAVGLVWALPRTSHWTALAIEEAGWVIEEKIYHLFGTGFPKHKSKLKPSCEEWVVCRNPGPLWLGIEDCRIPTNVGRPLIERVDHGLVGNVWDGGVDGSLCGSQCVGTTSQGRWPANVLLSHREECVCQGTKKVKSGNGVRGASTSIYGGGKGFTKATGEQVGYADADDTETIENWTCHPDCPIRLLDEQAGERRSYCSNQATAEAASGKEFVNKNRAVYELSKSNGKSFVRGRMYADKGGASRFYANFPAEEDTSRFFANFKTACSCSLCTMPYDRHVEKKQEESPCKITSAHGAAKSIRTILRTIASIVPPNVPVQRVEKIAHAVSIAGMLCGSCATGFALALVATQSSASSNEVLPLIRACITDSNKCFLIQSLASIVASQVSTDTIPTTASLSRLFGIAVPAIVAITSSEDVAREEVGSSLDTETRFRYLSKASKKDRGEGNRHNTVKSTTLMSWLVKLACPEGGLVLDPFAGSGSTGVACLRVGRRFFGVELDVESCSTSVRRLKAEE